MIFFLENYLNDLNIDKECLKYCIKTDDLEDSFFEFICNEIFQYQGCNIWSYQDMDLLQLESYENNNEEENSYSMSITEIK